MACLLLLLVGQNTINKGLALGILSCSKTLGSFTVSAIVVYFGDLHSQLYKLIGFSILTVFAILLSFVIRAKNLTTDSIDQHFILAEVGNIAQKLTPLFIVSLFFF